MGWETCNWSLENEEIFWAAKGTKLQRLSTWQKLGQDSKDPNANLS